ncbi:MAG: type II secretion system minor pseudopilin GspI [Gammaproteobacteria bacterium]|nr:type II secretion system minor pseudopilin GspI [Gammaproteobacteria bacterium]MCY4200394.1 type II secretion system minor pseudopilin GspI [Gammaproteobacteria bacterium]MCY4276373.1 type II secretion system minor pseudopilin GspI [Gammaproteobacteria bacterium]MCY4323996.1 type II secretion system minor pseudopilin GspI [Gammaproteobacteria bacterium]
MHSDKAFTLIEILVALLVLGIAMSMFGNATSGSLRSLERIEAGRVAGWVASNEMATARLERRVKDTPIETGRRQRLVQMAGREWEVTRTVRPTSHPWLRRVEVQVRLVESESFDDYATSLIGYVGRY